MTDNDEIKFNKVLNSGQLRVNLPTMLVMFGLMFFFYFLNKIDLIPRGLLLIGFLASFIAGWLTWSLLIPRWRIYAFSTLDEKFHVRLKEEAVKAKLIWSDGHFFEKTEIRTLEQKQKIRVINKRIDELLESESI